MHSGRSKPWYVRTYLEASSVTVDDRGIDEEPPDLWQRREKLRVCEKRLWNMNIRRLFSCGEAGLYVSLRKYDWVERLHKNTKQMPSIFLVSVPQAIVYLSRYSPILGTPSLSVRQYGSIRHFHWLKPSLCWEMEYIGSTLADVSSVWSFSIQWWKWSIYCDQHGVRISGLSTSTAGSVSTATPVQPVTLTSLTPPSLSFFLIVANWVWSFRDKKFGGNERVFNLLIFFIVFCST